MKKRMLPLEFIVLALLLSVGAGFLGAMLGLGGGVFVIPALIFLLGVPTHTAISVSIVTVIATSSAAAATYVERKITNIRLGMFLEIATTIGAVTGAFIATMLNPKILQVVFGLLLIYVSYVMLRVRGGRESGVKEDKLSSKLKLNGSYYDLAERRSVEYVVGRPHFTFSISYIAGTISGLLGVGGGVIKVPAMNILSRVPMKAAAATSNFMIGVTAAASAVVYFNRGFLDPFVAAPVTLGVLIGATMGARASAYVKGEFIRKIFVVALIIATVRLLLSGLGVA